MKKPITFGVLLIIIATLTVSGFSCKSVCPSEYNRTLLLNKNSGTAYMYKTDHVRIDADGAPNAYHPDDIKKHRNKFHRFKGLDNPDNAGYPGNSWWSSILVPDPNNIDEPYIQQSGPFKGFFVSMTALTDPTITDKTSPKRYVDSTKTPYIVFPGNYYKKKGSGKLGDLGYAINTSNGRKSAFVVADIGPSCAKLGEMSIELGRRLGGQVPNPITGKGSPKGEIVYIIFPYSSKSFPWPLTLSEIEHIAKKLLDEARGFDSELQS